MMLLMLTLSAWLSAESRAADPVPTLELKLVDPGGEEAALTVPLPWSERYTFRAGKRDYALEISAEYGGDDKVAVSGVVSELKRGKAKAVSRREVALREGREGTFQANFMAPKGMTDASGQPVLSLHWSFEGIWMLSGEGEALEAPAVPEGEYVAVWPTAQLYAAPREDAYAFRLSGAPTLVTEATPVTFRLLGQSEGWLELESVGGDARAHCGAAVPGFAGAALRLYARPEALSQVITEVIEHREDDGTGYTLNPGLPVQCDASGRCALVSRGGGSDIQAVLSLPASSLGDRYTPAASLGLRRGIRGLRPRAPSTVLATLGDASVETASSAVPIQALSGAAAPVVTVGHDCAVYRLSVLPSQVTALEEPEEPAAAAGPELDAGTALYWADGSPAGVLRGGALPEALSDVGGRRCWDAAQVAGQDPVWICVDP